VIAPPTEASFLRKILQKKRGIGPVVSFKGEAVKSVRTSWRKERERAGLGQEVALYSFRHTLARWMRSQGVPQWEVRGQLGHRAAGVTERYAEYAPDFQQAAIAAIEAFWKKVHTTKLKRVA
jgi:integrase